MSRPIAVWWIKRDARLADNACLWEAESLGFDVLPFFCFEPSLLRADDSSDMHSHAQWQALTALRNQLRSKHADLVLAHGEILEKLAKLHARVPFAALFAHEEVGNSLTFQRDRAVAAWCRQHGVTYREFPQSSVRRGGVNRDRLAQMWQQRICGIAPRPSPTIHQSKDLRELAASTAFPKLLAFAPHPSWQVVSEAAGQATLADFLTTRGRWYRGGISSPNTAFSSGSRLSVHLAWGTLTARQVWHAVQQRLAQLDPTDPATPQWKGSLQSFLSRLHWRDHFTQRLESEPELEFRSIHPCYRQVPYQNDERLHAAWREGQTGYPLVDAVMRCLSATGFVNFRMRAMVVSFACHVLHLDWRLIHLHLARVFRDYDPGIHLNQLQMQAGVVGWNAIRVYNPTKQLTDWDSRCRFVKQWVPELQGTAPEVIVEGNGLPHYPPPVVPFAPRAKQMMDHLYAIRKSAEAKASTHAVYVKHGSRKPDTAYRPKKATRARSIRRRKPPEPPTLFDHLPPD